MRAKTKKPAALAKRTSDLLEKCVDDACHAYFLRDQGSEREAAKAGVDAAASRKKLEQHLLGLQLRRQQVEQRLKDLDGGNL